MGTSNLRARILELEAENAKLAAGVCHDCLTDEHGNLRCGLEAENKKLKEALRPFMGFVFAPSIKDSDTFILQLGTAHGEYAELVPTVKAGDLRRAAALGEKP